MSTNSLTGNRTEVAVFVDLENIRYSTINSFGREPDPLVWRDKALNYGLMAVARAYADFDQHPSAIPLAAERGEALIACDDHRVHERLPIA